MGLGWTPIAGGLGAARRRFETCTPCGPQQRSNTWQRRNLRCVGKTHGDFPVFRYILAFSARGQGRIVFKDGVLREAPVPALRERQCAPIRREPIRMALDISAPGQSGGLSMHAS
jgi:hypothetical protein